MLGRADATPSRAEGTSWIAVAVMGAVDTARPQPKQIEAGQDRSVALRGRRQRHPDGSARGREEAGGGETLRAHPADPAARDRGDDHEGGRDRRDAEGELHRAESEHGGQVEGQQDEGAEEGRRGGHRGEVGGGRDRRRSRRRSIIGLARPGLVPHEQRQPGHAHRRGDEGGGRGPSPGLAARQRHQQREEADRGERRARAGRSRGRHPAAAARPGRGRRRRAPARPSPG